MPFSLQAIQFIHVYMNLPLDISCTNTALYKYFVNGGWYFFLHTCMYDFMKFYSMCICTKFHIPQALVHIERYTLDSVRQNRRFWAKNF